MLRIMLTISIWPWLDLGRKVSWRIATSRGNSSAVTLPLANTFLISAINWAYGTQQ